LLNFIIIIIIIGRGFCEENGDPWCVKQRKRLDLHGFSIKPQIAAWLSNCYLKGMNGGWAWYFGLTHPCKQNGFEAISNYQDILQRAIVFWAILSIIRLYCYVKYELRTSVTELCLRSVKVYQKLLGFSDGNLVWESYVYMLPGDIWPIGCLPMSCLYICIYIYIYIYIYMNGWLNLCLTVYLYVTQSKICYELRIKTKTCYSWDI